jgi:uncharacterized membrane protein YeaQ/YmgE (transglycosylase-associated protein family)
MDAGHGILAWIIIGIIAGWLTGKLMKGSGFGVIMDMVVGLIGALVGGFIATHVGIAPPGQQGLIVSILIAVVGAVVLTWLVRLVTAGRVREL